MHTSRLATAADIPALRLLMARAIETLLAEFLDPAAVAASRAIMGLDTQLIADGTFFIVEEDGVIAGCGGWSARATLYGGDHSEGVRDDSWLDPARDAARIRAMYTDPAFIRRGIGRLILRVCEEAAASAGFTRVELMATAAGLPLYAASGYAAAGAAPRIIGDAVVPLVRMTKTLE